ncbi:hypothetical protein Tco_0098414 [Tanacetum coccineum]
MLVGKELGKEQQQEFGFTEDKEKKMLKEDRMLQDIDREDLETLWKLVKTKHGDTRPEDEHERVAAGEKITTADYNCLKTFYCQEDKYGLKR